MARSSTRATEARLTAATALTCASRNGVAMIAPKPWRNGSLPRILARMTAFEHDATRAGSEPGAESDEDRLEAGTRIGEYVVSRKLGAGGFGAVYAAHHALLGRDVAIKILHRAVSSNQEIVGRFLAEARAVNQIRHRNIIDVFGFGQLEDGRHYYVMEFLDGEPLDVTLARKGRLSLADGLPILRGVAKALDAAHSHGIVHRDLKAENVYLARDGSDVYPKLLDFGIAKLISSEQDTSSRTRSGIQVGTPYAMAPEQCRGVAIDGRADVYALGVLAHRIFTGLLPFDGETAMDVIMQHMTAKPPSMSSVAHDLPSALDKPVLKMLAKNPNDRFTLATEAVDALEEAATRYGGDLSRMGGGPTPEASFSGSVARHLRVPTMRSAMVKPVRSLLKSGIFASVVLLVAAFVMARSSSWHVDPSGTADESENVAPVLSPPAPAPAVAPPTPAPVATAFEVQIIVTPSTARIIVDGVDRGEGQVTISRPASATLTVEARDPACKSRLETLVIRESLRLEWVLEKAPLKVVAPPRPRRVHEVHSDLANPLD